MKRAGDLAAADPGEQAGFLDVDARVEERRRDPFGEVFEGVGDVGAVAGAQGEVVDLVDCDDADPGVDGDAADGFDDVGDVRSAGDGQTEEAGELGGDHAGRCCGRDGDIEDRDPVGQPWIAGGVDGLVGLAELGDRGGLAGACRPGQDEPEPGGDRVPVEQGQPPPGGDHVTQR